MKTSINSFCNMIVFIYIQAKRIHKYMDVYIYIYIYIYNHIEQSRVITLSRDNLGLKTGIRVCYEIGCMRLNQRSSYVIK